MPGRRSRLVVAVALSVVVAFPASPARARPAEETRAGRHMGPVRFGNTTLRQTRAWFGTPTARRRMRLGCIGAIRVRWGKRLEVFFTARKPHTAVQATLRKRTIRSRRHGRLTIHTVRGLRLEDRSRKLRRLYPNARTVDHGDHWDHFLAPPAGGRLVALTATRRGRVGALFAGPYETC